MNKLLFMVLDTKYKKFPRFEIYDRAREVGTIKSPEELERFIDREVSIDKVADELPAHVRKDWALARKVAMQFLGIEEEWV